MYVNIGRQLEIKDAVVHLKMAKMGKQWKNVVEVVKNVVLVVRSVKQPEK
jgi:hypothetical protein